jgi:hypothetical protein
MRSALDPGAAAALVADGATVMIGGFMGVGSPHRVIAALVERGARGLTVIANDTARPGVGIGKLITAGCVARVIASHIATNPETQRLMLAGQLAVELVPQGPLQSASAPAVPDSAASSRPPASERWRPRAGKWCRSTGASSWSSRRSGGSSSGRDGLRVAAVRDGARDGPILTSIAKAPSQVGNAARWEAPRWYCGVVQPRSAI